MSSHHKKNEHIHEHNHTDGGKECTCPANGNCACGCHGGCEHEEESKPAKILLAASVVLTGLSFIPMPEIVRTIMMIIAVVIAIYPVALASIKNISKLKFTETELMLIAVIAACFLGEYREAVAVAVLYRIGELLEDKAVDRSRKSIDSLSRIQQDYANVILDDGTTEKRNADTVDVGTHIMVLPYERFPIDGVVVSGISTADASAITGESMPITLCKGVEIKSGMINGKEAITVVTTEEFKNSTASRIISMVEDATEKKGKTQKFITRVARIYTPVIVIVALVIGIVPSIITKDVSTWVYRALVFLVASCPCALVISVPLGFYTGLGTAAKKGIIVKGSVFVEAIAKAKAIVFDKTGTLTTGEFDIDRITPCSGFTKDQVFTLAAAAEHFSSHPIAKSIVKIGPPIDESQLLDFKEEAGLGSRITFGVNRVYCGSKRLMEENGIVIDGLPKGEIYVAVDNTVAGSILMKSAVRAGAADMIKELNSQGVTKTIILTGDNEEATVDVAQKCGIDEYYCKLLPQEKLEKLEEIKKEYGKVIYVGDGINDAPVLAAADAGVAMGMGTQAANEAADVILTNDSLERLAPAHKLFHRTYNIVVFNIVFSVVIKLIVLVFGALGFAPIWLAVFADVGVCLICVIISSLIGADKNTLFDRIKKKA